MPYAIKVFYAHPYPNRSRAGRTLLEAVRHTPGLEVRALYTMYPDFAIDVDAEQKALEEADLVVWQTPFYWYGVPALLSLWFEKVLSYGWAYGGEARALRGKTALWVTTTGAPADAYREGAMHGQPFEAFVPPLSQTARFCGMNWEPPFVVHGATRIGDTELKAAANAYRERLEGLAAPLGKGSQP